MQKSLAAVPAGKSTRDSLARIGDPDIEATLSYVASAQGSTEDGDADRTGSYAVGTATSDGQRFRVLRPHARGGLGAVFVALDSELNREVALKEILDHHADEAISRQRFLIEAEITGGLEHPGIVPVYGLGTYGNGRPYYAMRFIKGNSLKEAIERFHGDAARKDEPGQRSLKVRQLLRRFTDVCNAIDYAHSRGVLHRDIKPGNIIVGKHGETLVVDWGLAKPLGRVEPGSETGKRTLVPSSASGSADTLPGSALGTPAYMSPEQARGELDRLGPWSDVYSLGATLYCLLTGRPPVEGDDIGGVLRKVQRGQVVPPRSLDAAIDRALEAVCLKAMELEPENRYATCRALAEDIDGWMADEPVTAWREPLARRARRWMRRNRIKVTGAVAALLAGVVGLSAVLAVQTRANAALAQSLDRETAANVALAHANAELTRSKAAVQSRYDLAVQAVKTFHTGVSEDFLLREAQFKALRDKLLKSAAEFYQKLGALLGQETDAESRRALAASRYEVAELTSNVGDDAAALALHQDVLAARESLAADPSADVATKTDVGRSLVTLAIFLDDLSRGAEARAAFDRAEVLLADLARSSPESTAAQDELAHCRMALGTKLAKMGMADDALTKYRLARAYYEGQAGVDGATGEARAKLVAIIGNMGNVLLSKGRTKEAEAEYRAVSRIGQMLIDEFPANAHYHDNLAKTHNNLGEVLFDTGRPREAETEYRAALALWQALANETSAVVAWRNNLAFVRTNLGSLLFQTGRPREAEAEYRAAQELLRKLAEEHPAVARFRRLLANSLVKLATVLLALGRPAEARAEADKAVAVRRALVQADPRTANRRSALGEALLRAGQARRAMGDSTGAALQLREAVAMFEAMPPRAEEPAFFEGCCHAQLSALAGRNGSGVPAADGEIEAQAALRLLRGASSTGYRDPSVYRTDPALDPLRDRPDFQLLMMDLAFPAEPLAQ